MLNAKETYKIVCFTGYWQDGISSLPNPPLKVQFFHGGKNERERKRERGVAFKKP